MAKADEAVTSFKRGFSCSQAVLSCYSEELGLDRDVANRVACGFGGGIARMGNICGAVAGAIMVIGMKRGTTRPDDTAARERTYALVQQFIRDYTTKNGSIACPDLLGHDMADPVQFKEALEKKVAARICPGLVEDAVTVLERILNE
ncbi:C-GCAxxG-C-C family protein [Methanosphaerula palustris]|uniref:C_GCAxxG_C_C family protein n=1 Tax=Methanosphaerula palustris (strain ATCC BAA-1556 / DSM 19958 / E1-9c) TaxID=521011 RepID=B8GF21_METPE|nr:C-GCAxxG-C-C family protein [Methanosphaerula palustris]ACL17827.1 C_GCAxxG_C_C family protein [Methanosphaerula palustris E1-9c]